jgi:hypothetical protein
LAVAGRRHQKRAAAPVWKKAAAEVVALAAHSSTPRGAERDRAVTSPAAYDDRPVMIISTTSRKRLKRPRADDRHDHANHGDHHPDIRAWLRGAGDRHHKKGSRRPAAWTTVA